MPFKVGAYRRGGRLDRHTRPSTSSAAYRAGTPPRLAGVGKAIDEKLAELADTGRLRFYERLRRDVPPSRRDAAGGARPRPAHRRRPVAPALGIASLDDLEAAARDGRLRAVRGISEKTEAEASSTASRSCAKRPPAACAWARPQPTSPTGFARCSSTPGVRQVVVAGSFRRRRETVGDLDLLVETDDQPERHRPIAQRRLRSRRVGGHGGRPGGTARTTVQLLRGPQLDVMTMPPGQGRHLPRPLHGLGRAQRAAARDRARPRLEPVRARLRPARRRRRGRDGPDAEHVTFATEAEVYDFLGLPFIEPELREDRGEIEAALRRPAAAAWSTLGPPGRLPHPLRLVGRHEPIESARTELARRRGYRYQVLTDHSQSLTIANGLTPERVEQQRRIIAELNERFARERRREAPGASDGFRLLHGCEMEIRPDGGLDYDDELLAASTSSSRRSTSAGASRGRS